MFLLLFLFVKPAGVWSPCLSLFNLMVQAAIFVQLPSFWVSFFNVCQVDAQRQREVESQSLRLLQLFAGGVSGPQLPNMNLWDKLLKETGQKVWPFSNYNHKTGWSIGELLDRYKSKPSVWNRFEWFFSPQKKSILPRGGDIYLFSCKISVTSSLNSELLDLNSVLSTHVKGNEEICKIWKLFSEFCGNLYPCSAPIATAGSLVVKHHFWCTYACAFLVNFLFRLTTFHL